jgi:hypothetical protein
MTPMGHKWEKVGVQPTASRERRLSDVHFKHANGWCGRDLPIRPSHVARGGSLTGGDVGCARSALRDGARSSDCCPALPSLAPRRPGGVRHSLPAH